MQFGKKASNRCGQISALTSSCKLYDFASRSFLSGQERLISLKCNFKSSHVLFACLIQRQGSGSWSQSSQSWHHVFLALFYFLKLYSSCVICSGHFGNPGLWPYAHWPTVPEAHNELFRDQHIGRPSGKVNGSKMLSLPDPFAASLRWHDIGLLSLVGLSGQIIWEQNKTFISGVPETKP